VLTASAAQTSNICSADSDAYDPYYYIYSQSNLDELSACVTFTGVLQIRGYLPTNSPTPTESTLSLPTGLRTISGGIVIDSTEHLVTLDASHVEDLGRLSIANATNLQEVDLQSLHSSGFEFTLNVLPMLTELEIGSTINLTLDAEITVANTSLNFMPSISTTSILTHPNFSFTDLIVGITLYPQH
jgi:hypothetical protein